MLTGSYAGRCGSIDNPLALFARRNHTSSSQTKLGRQASVRGGFKWFTHVRRGNQQACKRRLSEAEFMSVQSIIRACVCMCVWAFVFASV